MTTTFPLTKRTGYASTYIPRPSWEASTFHTGYMRLDAVATDAIAGMEEDWIRTHYEFMPKRTIAELAQAHKSRLMNQSRKRYIDIDLPPIGDEGNW